ncbi:MAG TPA: hypothetical protein QGH10_24715, partial [Armatimonadota bacterium]|nr:hypothetical protein [Armatimonadota bacterium]
MVLSLLALSCLPAVGLAADDMPRSHTETITGASHEYTIRMGGTMDGVNTRDPVGYGAFGQVYEPNQFVRLENVGERPVVNPWVLVNGRHRWRTMEDIVDDAVSDLPPDASEEERVRAIWEFQRHHRFHATTGDAEVKDPVKMLNVYGYTLCGDDAHVLADIWRAAGFQTRSGRPQGHCTSEAYYSGDWHLLDGDENIICLLRDNETIAEEADIVRDHDLMKRTHTYGILSGDSRNTDEFSASLTVYDGDDRGGEWNSHIGHAMDFVLRPGESIEWRWDHREKAHGIWESKNLLTGWGETAWARHGNGYWRYEPKVNRRSFLDGLESQTSIATNVTRSPKLHPKLAGTASLVIPMAMPYVIVGGRVTLTGAQAEGGRISMALSFDGEKWEPVDMGTVQADLDPHFAQGGPARYSYLLRIDMEGGREVGLDGLLIENDLQMAQLSLPGLTLGDNRIAYADESEGPRNVKLTHSWVERSTSRAPSAPNEPIFPTDAGDAEGTRIIFEWEPAEDPDGDEIADYHFQLASRADMRWVLSPNFDKLIAKTADKGQARHALPYDGLLNPDQMYYWRVRARDGQGVWGEWSEIWSFTPRSVGVPLDVALSD